MKKTQNAKPMLKNVSLKCTKIVCGSAQTQTQLGIFTPFQVRFWGREALHDDRQMEEYRRAQFPRPITVATVFCLPAWISACTK